jgi:hypothetical protein
MKRLLTALALHGARTEETHDYYRHTSGGRTIHVHGYYHRSHG